MDKSSKQVILNKIDKLGKVKSSDLLKDADISRQMLARHLRDLVLEGKLDKSGSTRNAVYTIAKKGTSKKEDSISLKRNLKDLHEDEVFDEVDLRMNLKGRLSENVFSIVQYAFTEMLNNAIDHSKAKDVEIKVKMNVANLEFEVLDRGIGAFANAQKVFKLKDEYAALDHITKGKQTTFAERHSGQGIFFTSRIADEFEIKSHKIRYFLDNTKDDRRAGEIHSRRGTTVTFQIKIRSRKILEELFREYADADYEFDRGDVYVTLKPKQNLVSRSQAKLLMVGLDKYKIVTLDFKHVKEIGQAFVDEVFRVYRKSHPHVQILYRNDNPAVEFMLKRGE